jgi:hypothetical protein
MEHVEKRKRFVDDRRWLGDFADEFLVVCPDCDACARVTPRLPEQSRAEHALRLVCGASGRIREWKPGDTVSARGPDQHFHLRLWLTIPCCGEVLWAHNWRHLQFIEEYVGAVLRESTRDPKYGWSNKSLANRLPRWMKLARNREEILKAIAKLRATRG